MGEIGDHDHPFDEVVANATRLIEQGATCWQKFTCEQCGTRLSMEAPNKFYTEGRCDLDGHVTDLRVRGCNFMVILGEKGRLAYREGMTS